MELLILLIIIIMLCFILNVSVHYIILGIVILVGISSGLFAIAFVISGILLLFSKRKEAHFLRMGNLKGSKFQVAYYLVEGIEYPCIFPKEGILEDKLYPKGKTCHVMLNKKLGRVFDKFAVATTLLGFVFSVVFCAGLGMVFL